MRWRSTAVTGLGALVSMVIAAPPELPRRASFARESYPTVEITYGTLPVEGGTRLRTLVTRPSGVQGRLPAVLFVQWLSCDSIELDPAARDGWSLMLRRMITDSGALVWRTEKSGVGDSDGPACAALDYDTELAQHRAAYAALRQRPDVDPDRIVLFGASMGSTMVPLLAREHAPRAILTWGGGARSWLERQIAFDARTVDFAPATPSSPPQARAALRAAQLEFELQYLMGRRVPAAIVAEHPSLALAAHTIAGLEVGHHYGRPYSFHWQAQSADWSGAWRDYAGPVLALLGEHDWYEDPRSAALIADLVNERHPGRAEFRLVSGLDHHFVRFASDAAAFHDSGGTPDPGPALALMLPWLRTQLAGPAQR